MGALNKLVDSLGVLADAVSNFAGGATPTACVDIASRHTIFHRDIEPAANIQQRLDPGELPFGHTRQDGTVHSDALFDVTKSQMLGISASIKQIDEGDIGRNGRKVASMGSSRRKLVGCHVSVILKGLPHLVK
jgi:hypothetical protein